MPLTGKRCVMTTFDPSNQSVAAQTKASQDDAPKPISWGLEGKLSLKPRTPYRAGKPHMTRLLSTAGGMRSNLRWSFGDSH